MEFERMKVLELNCLTECSSIPAVIQLSQYTSETKDAATGTIGGVSSGFAFSIELYGAGYGVNSLSTNLAYLYKIASTAINPKITNELLFDKFVIFKINDYGSQSLSRGLLDFTVYCYTNSSKIPQKDIALIRNYTSKVSYILLDKTVYKSLTKLNVFVELKRYFETNIASSTTNLKYKMTLDTNTNKYSCDITSLISNMTLSSIKDLSLFVKNGNNYYKILNNINNYNPEISGINETVKIDSDQINYFSYIYNILYPSIKSDYVEKSPAGATEKKITFTLDNMFASQDVALYLGRTDKLVYLSSSNISNISAYNFTSDKDFKVFIKDISGNNVLCSPDKLSITYKYNFISGISTAEGSIIEIIPNNNYRRIFRYAFDGTDSNKINMHSILKSGNIYKYNLDLNKTYLELYENGLRKEPSIENGCITNLSGIIGDSYVLYIMDEDSYTTDLDETETGDFEFKEINRGVVENISIANDVTDPYVSYDGSYTIDNAYDINFYNGDNQDVLNCLTDGEAYIKNNEMYVVGAKSVSHTSFESIKDLSNTVYNDDIKAFKEKYNIENMDAAIKKIKEFISYIFDSSESHKEVSLDTDINLDKNKFIGFVFKVEDEYKSTAFDIVIKDSEGNALHEYNCISDNNGYYIYPLLGELYGKSVLIHAERHISTETNAVVNPVSKVYLI